jgi:hypothetical protein
VVYQILIIYIWFFLYILFAFLNINVSNASSSSTTQSLTYSSALGILNNKNWDYIFWNWYDNGDTCSIEKKKYNNSSDLKESARTRCFSSNMDESNWKYIICRNISQTLNHTNDSNSYDYENNYLEEDLCSLDKILSSNNIKKPKSGWNCLTWNNCDNINLKVDILCSWNWYKKNNECYFEKDLPFILTLQNTTDIDNVKVTNESWVSNTLLSKVITDSATNYSNININNPLCKWKPLMYKEWNNVIFCHPSMKWTDWIVKLQVWNSEEITMRISPQVIDWWSYLKLSEKSHLWNIGDCWIANTFTNSCDCLPWFKAQVVDYNKNYCSELWPCKWTWYNCVKDTWINTRLKSAFNLDLSKFINKKIVNDVKQKLLFTSEAIVTPNRFYANAKTMQNTSNWAKHIKWPDTLSNKRTTYIWWQPDSSCNTQTWSNLPINFLNKLYKNWPIIESILSPTCTSTSLLFWPSLEWTISLWDEEFGHYMKNILPKSWSWWFIAGYGSDWQVNWANVGILGIYTNFNPKWWIMKPWWAGNTTNKNLRAIFRSKQRLISFSIPNDNRAQLQQNLDVVFINKYCYENNFKTSKTYCSFWLNIKTFIKWDQEDAYDYGPRIYSDPWQNWLKVLLWNIKSKNEVTTYFDGRWSPSFKNWRDREVRTSKWQATYKDIFPYDTDFQIEISWPQFLNILDKVSPSRDKPLTDSGKLSDFWPKWDDNNEWYLLRVWYWQENIKDTNWESSIEWLFKDIEVISTVD